MIGSALSSFLRLFFCSRCGLSVTAVVCLCLFHMLGGIWELNWNVRPWRVSGALCVPLCRFVLAVGGGSGRGVPQLSAVWPARRWATGMRASLFIAVIVTPHDVCVKSPSSLCPMMHEIRKLNKFWCYINERCIIKHKEDEKVKEHHRAWCNRCDLCMTNHTYSMCVFCINSSHNEQIFKWGRFRYLHRMNKVMEQSLEGFLGLFRVHLK